MDVILKPHIEIYKNLPYRFWKATSSILRGTEPTVIRIELAGSGRDPEEAYEALALAASQFGHCLEDLVRMK